MANDPSGQVRSHRNGPPRRRRPWRAIGTVTVLVAALLTAGVTYYTTRGCSGRDTAVVAASPDIAPLLDQLNTAWTKTAPSVHGRCVSVTIEARDSALMAIQLAGPWDPLDNGPPPDAWVPSSSVWARDAATSATAARMLPDRQPSIARSPSVIAMPKTMAIALGWPGKVSFDWPDIAKAAADPGFWTKHGQKYGRFTFSMTDPKTSTAGLLSLMSVADPNNDGAVTSTELDGVLSLKPAMHRYLADTSDVLATVAKADQTSVAAVLATGAAFPALERDVIEYDKNRPHEPLVALYPTSGSLAADYPFLILTNPPWGTMTGPIAAGSFLTYVRGPAGRALFLANGYRDDIGTGGADLTAAYGATPGVANPPRTAPSPDSVAQTLTTWTAVTRRTNLLLVLDVSGSMNDIVSGRTTRMDLAKAAAIAAVRRFDSDSSVGLWVFSTGLDGKRDYKSLVPLGTLSDTMSDGGSRRDDMINAISTITATGDTGLYDTIAAAQREVIEHYQRFATNLVVLMTDGRNDDTTGGIGLAQLRQKLTSAKASRTNVPVVTIGFGADADYATLASISHTSGTISLSSAQGVDIDKVLLAGIFATPTSGGD
jgi:Ca-activated chloride channel homolog